MTRIYTIVAFFLTINGHPIPATLPDLICAKPVRPVASAAPHAYGHCVAVAVTLASELVKPRDGSGGQGSTALVPRRTSARATH